MQTQVLEDSLNQEHVDSSSSGNLDLLWLELTTKCNLNCIHCYADSGPWKALHDKLELGDWMDAMLQAYQLGCRCVTFIGGEPTLYPGLPDLLEYGRSLALDTMEVFTNGCTVSDRLKEAFRRYGVDMAFSIYSLDEKVHDAVTGREGSLAETLLSIRWALGAGLSVRVGIIEVEANTGTTDITAAALFEMGVASVCVDRVRRIGRGLRKENPPQSLFQELCGGCGRNALCLASSGQLFPCVFSRFYPVGSLNLGLAAALEGPELRSFLSTLEAVQPNVRIEAGGGDHRRCATKKPNPPPPPSCPPTCLPEYKKWLIDRVKNLCPPELELITPCYPSWMVNKG